VLIVYFLQGLKTCNKQDHLYKELHPIDFSKTFGHIDLDLHPLKGFENL